MNLFKSILHNIGVLAVGFIFAFLCTRLDKLLGIKEFYSMFAVIAACLLLAIDFLLRVWATYYFYQQKMKVIVLHPQNTLLTSGPYRFSRNPLYLGGNIFIFFGAAMLLGTPTGLVITILHLPLVDLVIRREEKQLAMNFGGQWTRYRNQVRRWL